MSGGLPLQLHCRVAQACVHLCVPLGLPAGDGSLVKHLLAASYGALILSYMLNGQQRSVPWVLAEGSTTSSSLAAQQCRVRSPATCIIQ